MQELKEVFIDYLTSQFKSHTIILPDLEKFSMATIPWQSAQYVQCFFALQSYFPQIKVIIDHEAIAKRIKSTMGKASIAFLFDDELFLTNCADEFYSDTRWLDYCMSVGVKGFFILCHRFSTSHIFEERSATVFPLPYKPGPFIAGDYLEHDAHSYSLLCKKDISIFFHGRHYMRKVRAALMHRILRTFKNTHMKSPVKTNNPKLACELLGPREYIDIMCRSKIIWCPRSVYSEPDRDANALTCKEIEAMCLEILVVRPPIGVLETEPRLPGVHYVEYKNDNSDLIEKLQYYLDHEDERKEIARNGRLWYERNCSVTARACIMIKNCIQALQGV